LQEIQPLAKKQRLQVEKGTVADLNGKLNILSGEGSGTNPGMRVGGQTARNTRGKSEKLKKKPAAMISIHNAGVLVCLLLFFYISTV
jgi:hypothetical protein